MFSGLSAMQPSALRWTALVSFLVQAVLVTSALIFPMIYPQRLPAAFFDRRIFVPLSNGEVHVENNTHGSSSSGPLVRQALVVSRNGISFQQHPMETGAEPDAPALGPAVGPGPDLGPFVRSGPGVLPPPPIPHPERIDRTRAGARQCPLLHPQRRARAASQTRSPTGKSDRRRVQIESC